MRTTQLQSARIRAHGRTHLTPKTALVLAGGGSLGGVQAGMLIELAATGFHPEFVDVFPTLTLGGRPLFEGVVADSTPIATSVRLGATRVLVLPCGVTCVDTAVPNHALGRAVHAITLMGTRHVRQGFE